MSTTHFAHGSRSGVVICVHRLIDFAMRRRRLLFTPTSSRSLTPWAYFKRSYSYKITYSTFIVITSRALCFISAKHASENSCTNMWYRSASFLRDDYCHCCQSFPLFYAPEIQPELTGTKQIIGQRILDPEAPAGNKLLGDDDVDELYKQYA